MTWEPDSPEYIQCIALVKLRRAEARKFHAEMAASIALTILFTTLAVCVGVVTYCLVVFV